MKRTTKAGIHGLIVAALIAFAVGYEQNRETSYTDGERAGMNQLISGLIFGEDYVTMLLKAQGVNHAR